jgi:hypothetical protein
VLDKTKHFFSEFQWFGSRFDTWQSTRALKQALHGILSEQIEDLEGFEKQTGLALTKATALPHARFDGDGKPKFEVHSLSPIQRVRPDGTTISQVVGSIIQTCDVPMEGGGKFHYRGGCTMVIDLDSMTLRYCVRKTINHTALLVWRDTELTGRLRWRACTPPISRSVKRSRKSRSRFFTRASPEPCPAKKTTRRKATTKRGKARLRVRMYRQGLGDCFLLTFNSKVHVLIDCGVIVGTAQPEPLMTSVVENIRKETNGEVDVLVVTHEHWDHVSGFKQAQDAFEKLKFKQVWMAWTEEPGHPLSRSPPRGTQDENEGAEGSRRTSRQIRR